MKLSDEIGEYPVFGIDRDTIKRWADATRALEANQRTERDRENERLRQAWKPCAHTICHFDTCDRCREYRALHQSD